MAETVKTNCDSCEVNGGAEQCAILGRLAASGMSEQKADIAKVILSIGRPLTRADMHIPVDPESTVSSANQRFYSTLAGLESLPYVGELVTKTGERRGRRYSVDREALPDACAALVQIPVDIIQSQTAKKEVIDDRTHYLQVRAIAKEWILHGVDATAIAVHIKSLSPKQLTDALISAKQFAVNSVAYTRSDDAVHRLARLSGISTDEHGGTSGERVLAMLAPSNDKPDSHDETDTEKSSWQNLANCLGVDPDLFFPERGASTREAKNVCKGCVVRGECLEYALANGEKFGIWGGLSERERRRIRRQRALAKRATLATVED